MSKDEKILKRFKTLPNDFTFQEMCRLLSIAGYQVDNSGKTSGSRVKFISINHPNIMFHKPHPQNIIPHYVMIEVYEVLCKEGIL